MVEREGDFFHRLGFFFPEDGKGHRDAKESVFDKCVIGKSDFFEKSAEIVFGEKSHVVTGSPGLADFYDDGIKILFGKKEVKEWYARVEFDGKMAIGSGEIATTAHADEFRKKTTLISCGADMFDDGVGVGDSKGVVSKRERPAITRDGSNERIALLKSAHITHANGGYFSGMGIEFFKVIVGSRVFRGVDTNIDDRFIGLGRGQGEELRKLLGSTLGRDRIGNFFNE